MNLPTICCTSAYITFVASAVEFVHKFFLIFIIFTGDELNRVHFL